MRIIFLILTASLLTSCTAGGIVLPRIVCVIPREPAHTTKVVQVAVPVKEERTRYARQKCKTIRKPPRKKPHTKKVVEEGTHPVRI